MDKSEIVNFCMENHYRSELSEAEKKIKHLMKYIRTMRDTVKRQNEIIENRNAVIDEITAHLSSTQEFCHQLLAENQALDTENQELKQLVDEIRFVCNCSSDDD